MWDYPPAGGATHGLQPVLMNISREQVKQGYEVHVVAGREGSPPEENDQGVIVHRVGSPYSTRAFSAMTKILGEGGDWIVHAHATSGFFLFPFRYFRRFPLVSHVHGTARGRFPVDYRGGQFRTSRSLRSTFVQPLRERLAWSSSDVILTVCQAAASDIEAYYGMDPQSIRTVYNGVDPVTFSPRSEWANGLPGLEGKKVVLYVGHFGPRKGILQLIRAMKAVKAEEQSAHLLCIGGVPSWLGTQGYWDMLRHEIGVQGLANDVTLMDTIKHFKLPEFYNAASAFALPSYYEAFPKVVLEAMACGKAVVATDGGGVPEMVENGVSGTLVRFGDVPRLAESIAGILRDERLARSYGKRARERVEAMFTWKKVVERISNAYEAVLREN